MCSSFWRKSLRTLSVSNVLPSLDSNFSSKFSRMPLALVSRRSSFNALFIIFISIIVSLGQHFHLSLHLNIVQHWSVSLLHWSQHHTENSQILRMFWRSVARDSVLGKRSLNPDIFVLMALTLFSISSSLSSLFSFSKHFFKCFEFRHHPIKFRCGQGDTCSIWISRWRLCAARLEV